MKNAAILIVDDDSALREVLATGLRRLGVRVTLSGSVDEADATLAREKFDLIVSDVHLPGNEHLRWTERLLREPAAPPILLMTGNPEVVTAMRAANLAVAGYLAKPVSFAEFSALVQRLLTGHRQRLTLQALASEVRELIATTSDLPAETSRRLDALSVSLAAEAARPIREQDRTHQASQQAIRDTISVLERTRDSFQSKELGRLRRHLKQVLARGAALWTILDVPLSEASWFVSLPGVL